MAQQCVALGASEAAAVCGGTDGVIGGGGGGGGGGGMAMMLACSPRSLALSVPCP